MAGSNAFELSLDTGNEQRTSSRCSFPELSNEDEVIICSQTLSEGGTYVNVDHSDLGDYPSVEMSTSVVLHCCKQKVLLPYLRLLSLLGWRPLLNVSHPRLEPFTRLLNLLYMMFVSAIIITGYVFQFAACFRRDGLVSSKIKQQTIENNIGDLKNSSSSLNIIKIPCTHYQCEGNIVSNYIFPDVLHLAAYIYMVFLMYHPENEQVQTLMERVFLQSAITQAWHIAQQRLIKMLRLFLAIGAIWLLVSLAAQLIHACSSEMNFTWMEYNTPMSESVKDIVIVLMMMSLTWNDMICVGIVTSYSVHCQLIISYLTNLCCAVREKCINFQEFVRDIQESKKFLKYLNDALSVSVSLLILNFGCQVVTGIYGFLMDKTSATRSSFDIVASVITLVLWIFLIIFPIFQAARLMEACRAVKKLGHELRARPFGYLDTCQDDLDSLLIYTSTLKLKVKMFHLPVKASCLMLCLAVIIFIIFILGQLNVVNL